MTLPEEDKQFAIYRLGELFHDVDRFIIKGEQRENPKLISFSLENTQMNEYIYEWYKNLVGRKFDRIEGKKNFVRLAN